MTIHLRKLARNRWPTNLQFTPLKFAETGYDYKIVSFTKHEHGQTAMMLFIIIIRAGKHHSIIDIRSAAVFHFVGTEH